jgi:hypothetical protein
MGFPKGASIPFAIISIGGRVQTPLANSLEFLRDLAASLELLVDLGDHFIAFLKTAPDLQQTGELLPRGHGNRDGAIVFDLENYSPPVAIGDGGRGHRE